jgi:hypothetical protein
VAHTCNSSYSKGKDQKDHDSKSTNKKRAGGVAQAVDCLPSKCEAFSSNPIINRNKIKKKQEKQTHRDARIGVTKTYFKLGEWYIGNFFILNFL